MSNEGFYPWLKVDTDPTVQYYAHTGATRAYRNDAPGALLMSWGPIQFMVFPLNYEEMDHETGTDWARKEIVGAAIYREWVGENDETRHLRGKVFPYRIGGNTMLETFDAYRRSGIPNLLMGGDGLRLGWFVCEKLIRNHTWIGGEGIGQQINFEALMTRVPVPDASDYVSQLFTLTS